MIDKRLTDKPLQFELSIGNTGNSLDGHHDSAKRSSDLDCNLGERTSGNLNNYYL